MFICTTYNLWAMGEILDLISIIHVSHFENWLFSFVGRAFLASETLVKCRFQRYIGRIGHATQ